jgi:hypothetical protein
VAAGVLTLACHDSNDPPARPQYGAIRVSNTTSGPLIPGPPYFNIMVDSGVRRILRFDSVLTVDSILTGAHQTELLLLRSQCSVPDSIRPATVVAAETTTVDFAVSCAVNWGFLQVGLPTTGPNQPGLLTVTFDGATLGGASPNTVGLGFPYVLAGAHSVGLLGAGANCTIAEANPQDVVIPLDDTLHIDFTLTCS